MGSYRYLCRVRYRWTFPAVFSSCQVTGEKGYTGVLRISYLSHIAQQIGVARVLMSAIEQTSSPLQTLTPQWRHGKVAKQ